MSCREVLAVLSDFVDGDLGAQTKERVMAHVGGCDVCERFGNEFAKMIAAVRAELREAESLAPDVEARLQTKLRGI